LGSRHIISMAALLVGLAACGDDAAAPTVDAAPISDAIADAAPRDAPPGSTAIAVANPSFELPAIAAGTFDVSAPPIGWSAFGSINGNERSVGVLDPTTTTLYAAVPHGDNVAVVYLNDLLRSPAGIEQTLATSVAGNTTYTLGVSVGHLGNVTGHDDFTGFPHYRIELRAGTTVLAADDNSLAPADAAFARATLTATTAAGDPAIGQALTIRLVNLSAAPGIEVNFDDVTLIATPIGG